MTLSLAKIRVPTTTGRTVFRLVDEDGTVELREIRARAAMLDQEGIEILEESWSGDLMPHMTQAEKTWLNDFLDKYRTLADTRIPTP